MKYSSLEPQNDIEVRTEVFKPWTSECMHLIYKVQVCKSQSKYHWKWSVYWHIQISLHICLHIRYTYLLLGTLYSQTVDQLFKLKKKSCKRIIYHCDIIFLWNSCLQCFWTFSVTRYIPWHLNVYNLMHVLKL